MTTDNPNFARLPNEIKKQINKKKACNLDQESIYYQACQALISSRDDDIIWAKEQFLSIAGYKDSEEKISECNAKIAGV